MANSLRAGETNVCRDLSVERVMIPRILSLALFTGLVFVTGVLVRRYWRRSTRRPSKSANENNGGMHPTQHNTRMQTWLRYGIVGGVIYTVNLLLNFQSFSYSSGLSATLARPRIVFSFTTISDGITKMQPTLDALIAQDGQGFDAIYVVVPREYREKPIEFPSWLVTDVNALPRSDFHGITFAAGPSAYHEKVHVIALDTDYGPASKILGTLLVEQDEETILVYGDDDRMYPPQLCDRALHYTSKFPNEAIAVLGGWISAEDALYCGRSLNLGVNSISFVGGAGGVAVRRKFYGLGKATLPVFNIANLSKSCFLGDDYYLSHVLSNNGVPRRLVYDTCWNIDNCGPSYPHGGLSYSESAHPGGANVEHYQQCIRELGIDQDLSGDGEFGFFFMYIFAHIWGSIRGISSLIHGSGFVPC